MSKIIITISKASTGERVDVRQVDGSLDFCTRADEVELIDARVLHAPQPAERRKRARGVHRAATPAAPAPAAARQSELL